MLKTFVVFSILKLIWRKIYIKTFLQQYCKITCFKNIFSNVFAYKVNFSYKAYMLKAKIICFKTNSNLYLSFFF